MMPSQLWFAGTAATIPTMLLIVTAVIIEAKPIAQALGLTKCSATRWAGPSAHLQVAGIRATRFSADMVPKFCKGIVLAGLAGALDMGLAVGDVVMDAASGKLPAAPPCRVGAMYCADAIASTPAEKAELHRQTGALAVEMEADVIRRIAAEKGLPFLHVRAISDTATERLNPVVMRLVDSMGRPKPLTIARTLFFRPDLIPVLNHLRAASNIATHNLAQVVGEIMASGWPER
jgi:adenosylhomocysteine nucleosidase